MRAAISVAVLCAVSGSAMAGPQFAALDFGSVTPASVASVVATGEGSNAVALSGNLGPFFGGAFSVSFAFSFESHSVSGDGVAALMWFQPTFSSGQLSVTNVDLTANLFDGATHVSTLSVPGQVAQSASITSAFEVLAVAQSFERNGAAPFEFIGDRGTIQVTLDLVWSGAAGGQSLALELLEGSQVEYLTYIPTPSAALVMAMGAGLGLRRRR
jgi:hypothetical protein